jgi:hypothetical protein
LTGGGSQRRSLAQQSEGQRAVPGQCQLVIGHYPLLVLRKSFGVSVGHSYFGALDGPGHIRDGTAVGVRGDRLSHQERFCPQYLFQVCPRGQFGGLKLPRQLL